MNDTDTIRLVDRLCLEPTETEWLEFKKDRYDPQILGEYLSALANSACLAGKPRGYLLFGIDNDTHEVAGTRFDPYAAKGKGSQDLLIWLSMGLQPNVGVESCSLKSGRRGTVRFVFMEQLIFALAPVRPS